MPVAGGPILSEDHLGLPEPVEPLRPLGRRQYAFWMLQQLRPGTAVSNLAVAFRTERTLRWWPLHAALNHLIARHPALRTRFPVVAGVPLQHVSAAGDVELTVEVGLATEADLTARLVADARTSFDLATDLPLRLFLVQIEGGGSAVLLVVHHIITDGGSFAVLTHELARMYDGIAAGGGIPAELRDELPTGPAAPPRPEDAAFWAEHLRGVEAARAVMPWARPSPVHPTFAGTTMFRSLAPETLSAVADLRRTLGSTENLILLTAWYLTLFRHGAGTDLVVGVPVNRRDENAESGVGFQVSTLPLRVRIDPAASFTELNRRVRDVFLAGAQHASMSVEEVLAELGHQSAEWWVPVFRYMYNYRPWDETDVSIGGERPVPLEVPSDESRLDINLAVTGGRRPSVLVSNHSTELFDDADIVALLRRMEALVAAAAADPGRPINALALATDDERAVLAAANDTTRDAFPNTTVLAQFLARAQAAPDTTAVVDGAATLSYRDLAAIVRRFAARLRADGLRCGDVVALALPRGAAMAAAMLGVWAAGGCYLPLDAEQPAQRLATLVADAGARLVVAESEAFELAGLGPAVPVVAWSDATADDLADDLSGPSLDDTAYVIYTSGSTGQPRGVVITHRNLANVVADFAERLGTTADDAVLWSTTTAFDISGLELFLPLSTGATVVVLPGESQARPGDLLDLVRVHDVSVIQATPTFWRLALAEDADQVLRGRAVLCGGEPMSASLARDLLATGCRLFNVYGPTETTIWSTVAEISGDVADPMPIGAPIANTRVFITDEHGAELPPGLLGELCIAGTGTGVGYLGRPDLTAERFASSPTWGRYYRTGDLARWRSDGVLELFGRNDRQVKVRGHRIELPEIEAALRSHDDVVEAAVVLVGDPQGDAELRAFVRPRPGVVTAGLPERLWPHLRERLPSYALPSRVLVVEDFPVTPNGKVDHAALRSVDVATSAAVSAAPAEDRPDPDPELTVRLLKLWRDTLNRPALGERDHFFLNGGHSLLAVQLAGRIADTIGTEVPVRMIFDHPTARLLSASLAEGR